MVKCCTAAECFNIHKDGVNLFVRNIKILPAGPNFLKINNINKLDTSTRLTNSALGYWIGMAVKMVFCLESLT